MSWEFGLIVALTAVATFCVARLLRLERALRALARTTEELGAVRAEERLVAQLDLLLTELETRSERACRRLTALLDRANEAHAALEEATLAFGRPPAGVALPPAARHALRDAREEPVVGHPGGRSGAARAELSSSRARASGPVAARDPGAPELSPRARELLSRLAALSASRPQADR